jgi:hypothetical protein
VNDVGEAVGDGGGRVGETAVVHQLYSKGAMEPWWPS